MSGTHTNNNLGSLQGGARVTFTYSTHGGAAAARKFDKTVTGTVDHTSPAHSHTTDLTLTDVEVVRAGGQTTKKDRLVVNTTEIYSDIKESA